MLAIIGGSGFDQWPEIEIINNKSIDTPYGKPSSNLMFVRINGNDCILLSRHGQPHAIAPHLINYRANIWALKQQGVSHIIATAAVGAIDEYLHQPCLVLPHDIIDYTYGRMHTYSDLSGQLQHIDFTSPYDEEIRAKLLQAAQEQEIPLFDKAIYAAVQGPRLETAAEVRKMQADGANIIGMTGMPEASLARELGIRYACLAMCVNPAAGMGNQAINIDDIMNNIKLQINQVHSVLNAFS